MIVSSRTMIAVGQGEAATEVLVEIATIGETEVGEVIQTVSGSIDRSDPATVIDLTVLNVLRNLNVLIIPAVGEIVNQYCNSSSHH